MSLTRRKRYLAEGRALAQERRFLNIPANQPITQSVAFQALDILNAAGISILNSNQAIQTIEQAALIGTALNAAGL